MQSAGRAWVAAVAGSAAIRASVSAMALVKTIYIEAIENTLQPHRPYTGLVSILYRQCKRHVPRKSQSYDLGRQHHTKDKERLSHYLTAQ